MEKTPLYERHIAAGAKMAPFGGYEMPIYYKKGIIAEHTATRTAVTMFDTCHMGELLVTGASAPDDMERIISCPIETMKIGQCRYGYLCNNEGGVLDDLIVYRQGTKTFYIVVNAATKNADFDWISRHISAETTVENLSDRTAKIDIQGPLSARIITRLFEYPVINLKYYSFMENMFRGERVLISRTGYTGEIGFEVYLPKVHVLQFWDVCLDAGVMPAGLGARDTLRLEMGFPLYGHELDASIPASWSGFSKAIGEKQFIGADACRQSAEMPQRLVGLIIDGRRSAHAGDTVSDVQGTSIGRITSGSYSPSIGCAIALGYVRKNASDEGTPLCIRTERGNLTAQAAALPFYKNATGRRPMEQFL